MGQRSCSPPGTEETEQTAKTENPSSLLTHTSSFRPQGPGGAITHFLESTINSEPHFEGPWLGVKSQFIRAICGAGGCEVQSRGERLPGPPGGGVLC